MYVTHKTVLVPLPTCVHATTTETRGCSNACYHRAAHQFTMIFFFIGFHVHPLSNVMVRRAAWWALSRSSDFPRDQTRRVRACTGSLKSPPPRRHERASNILLNTRVNIDIFLRCLNTCSCDHGCLKLVWRWLVLGGCMGMPPSCVRNNPSAVPIDYYWRKKLQMDLFRVVSFFLSVPGSVVVWEWFHEVGTWMQI